LRGPAASHKPRAMPSLKDIIVDETRRKTLAGECMALIEHEVDSKGGLGGIAVKTGFKAVRGIKPGFVEKVVYDLLPEFADAIEPFANEAKSQGKDVVAHISTNAPRVADALLAITDKKAERSSNGVVKSAYGKLRGMAKSNVESAIPGLAKLVKNYEI